MNGRRSVRLALGDFLVTQEETLNLAAGGYRQLDVARQHPRHAIAETHALGMQEIGKPRRDRGGSAGGIEFAGGDEVIAHDGVFRFVFIQSERNVRPDALGRQCRKPSIGMSTLDSLAETYRRARELSRRPSPDASAHGTALASSRSIS
ncbi:hypothetical protein D9M68_737780 [compost metagenome]